MDFSTPPRTAELLARVHELVDREIIPLETERTAGSFRDLLPRLEAVRQKVKRAGLWCPQLPRQYGGLGLSLIEYGQVSEVLGRSTLGHYCFNCQAPDAGNMEILIHYGSQEQQDKYLRPLVEGRVRSCFSMTEPDRPGSNPTWMETTAVRDGDDYVINGRKWFTTSCDGAAFAIVMAVTSPDAPRHQRASQIIVPLDTPGFRLVRNIPVMGHTGDDYDSHAEVEYDNCRVPAADLLGGEGEGFRIAQERLGPGRIHHTMRWIGICERAFDLMCRRAAERRIEPDETLGQKQIVQSWIAECRAQINAARLLVLQAAWKIDQEGTGAAREEISLIKFFAADVLMNVLDRAIQVHGALGLTDDTPLATFWRNERAARIYDGPDEVHKMVVARRILKRYGVETRKEER
jgi:alkylation response protein AidB-like acyl-CoA dehydrogenase